MTAMLHTVCVHFYFLDVSIRRGTDTILVTQKQSVVKVMAVCGNA